MYAWLTRSFTWLGDHLFARGPETNPPPSPVGYEPVVSPAVSRPVIQMRRPWRSCSQLLLGTCEFLFNCATHALGTALPVILINIAAAMQTTLQVEGENDPAQLTLTEIKGMLISAAPFIVFGVLAELYANRQSLRFATLRGQYQEARAHVQYIHQHFSPPKALAWYVLLTSLVGVCSIDGAMIGSSPLKAQGNAWQGVNRIFANGTLQELHLAETVGIVRWLSLWTFLIKNSAINAAGISLFGLYIAHYFYMKPRDLAVDRQIGRQIKVITSLLRQIDGMEDARLEDMLRNMHDFFVPEVLQNVAQPMLLSPTLPRESVRRGRRALFPAQEPAIGSRRAEPSVIRRRRPSTEAIEAEGGSTESGLSAFPLGGGSPPQFPGENASADADFADNTENLELPAHQVLSRFRMMMRDSEALTQIPGGRAVGWALIGAAAYKTWEGINISVARAVAVPPIAGYDRFLKIIGCSTDTLGIIQAWDSVLLIKMTREGGKGMHVVLEAIDNTLQEGRRTGTYRNAQTAYFTLSLIFSTFTALTPVVLSRAFLKLGADPAAMILPFILGYCLGFPSLSAMAGIVMRSRGKIIARLRCRPYQPSSTEELREGLREIWLKWVEALETSRRARNPNRALIDASARLGRELQAPQFASLYARLSQEGPEAAHSARAAPALRPEPTAV